MASGVAAGKNEGMNRKETFTGIGGREAEVLFMDADFKVVRPGDFVRCAVTGRPIPLDQLRYWSVELQEAYASPEIALQRHLQLMKERDEG